MLRPEPPSCCTASLTCVVLLNIWHSSVLNACRQLADRFRNGEMCRLTEQVIFMDPFYAAAVNKHTSPQLDDAAQGLYTDVEAKVAVSELKVRERLQAAVAPARLHLWVHGCSIAGPACCHCRGLLTCQTATLCQDCADAQAWQ